MKPFLTSLLFFIIFYSCQNTGNNQSSENKQNQAADSISIIKKPFENSPNVIEYEIPVKKGTNTKHGVQKRYYKHGSIYSEIPYINGKREGVVYTYYPVVAGAEPIVWKEQQYKNNKLDRTCRRYHESGALQSEYEYKDGLPATGLKEFYESGNPVKMPELIVEKHLISNYFYVTAVLSNGSKNVTYYMGDLIEGKYMPDNLKGVQEVGGKGEVLLPLNTESVTITALYITRYRNRYIVSKTINL